jgi:hypothetical protein
MSSLTTEKHFLARRLAAAEVPPSQESPLAASSAVHASDFFEFFYFLGFSPQIVPNRSGWTTNAFSLHMDCQTK